MNDITKKGLEFIKEIEMFCDRNSEWLIRDEEETDPRHGIIPKNRSVSEYISNGIINLDKPPGPTSHEVVAWVKKMFGLNKAGHGGTLEPLLCAGAGLSQGYRSFTGSS